MSGRLRNALEGITVCDFSWVGAGPIATNVLGQCGANVIKIESKTRLDILRRGEPFKDGIGTGIERSGYFANRNPNKRGIALNMSHPKAREIAVRLIQKSDITINNFRVGQMEKWRLGWNEVREINPRNIYVTMSMQGTSGPHKDYMGYGVNLNALGGLTARAGFPGLKPFGTGTNYTDHVVVPTHTIFGIMAALIEREVTGRGQTVAISQLQSAICVTPTDPIVYSANGEVLEPLGCGDPGGAPHGVYTTLGYRNWVAISVFSDEQWRSLRLLMGQPKWADDPKFSSLASRSAHEEELDTRIEEWTQWQQADSLVDRLLRAGVPAGRVNDARAVIEDKHMNERGFFQYLDHPEVGITLYNRAPIKFSKTPVQMRTAAPLLGAHTQEVLSELLGYSDTEIKELAREEVLN